MARFTFPNLPAPADVNDGDWNDWSWQLRRSLKRREDFETRFDLNEQERAAFDGADGVFNIRATPYYAALAGDLPDDPIRKIMMPRSEELEDGAQVLSDPLAEGRHSVAPRIVHRYSDRVLFLVTDFCSVYCRYCTRKHFTGREQSLVRGDEYRRALDYIRSHPGIREVILSGGDPLTLSDQVLDGILADIRAIEHVEIIRIGSRLPVVAPMRITEGLTRILRAHAPVYLMTHFNHPRELTGQAAQALGRLVDAGVPVMNQMVLLNGVNNDAAIIQALSRRLLFLRVKPYYMFQCDPSPGTDHLRTSIDESLEIQRELWGHLSGLAMPTYAVDIPDGGGKTVLTPNFEVAREKDRRVYVGWDGVKAEYVDPTSVRVKPSDAGEYQAEWEALKAAKILTTDAVDKKEEPRPRIVRSPGPQELN